MTSAVAGAPQKKAIAPDKTRPAISTLQLFSYGGPAFILFLLWVPVTVYLPQLYAKHTGLSFTVIGTIIVVSKILDAIFDQVVGFLSDKTESRLGRRKPWMMLGTAIMLPSLYFLFNPSPTSGAVYLAVTLNGFYFGWSMILIPYSAMAPEMSTGYEERTRLAGAYGMGTSLGQLTFNLLPIGLFLFGFAATSEYSVGVLGATFWLCAVLAPLLILLATLFLPSNASDMRVTPSLRGLAKSLSQSKPFLIYAAAFFMFTAATGVQAAVAFTFYDSYLKIGGYLPYLIMIVVVATTVSVPAWTFLSNRLGKHRALAIGWIIITVALQGYWFLTPGPVAPFIIAGLMVLIGFSQGINPVSQNAIIADLVDYGTWKTGEANSGSYYAAQAFLMKLAQAVGSGCGFLLLGLVGFNVQPGTVNSDGAISGLFMTLILAPTVLNILALVLIQQFPLDRRRLAIIEKRITLRNSRSQTEANGD